MLLNNIFRKLNTFLVKQPIFQASRKKLLLKRKKINMKKLPVSKKKLKELKHNKSNIILQHEQQIKQKLSHRPNINKNINQLVQELYFPDLRMATEQAAMKHFKIENLRVEAEDEQLILQSAMQQKMNSNLNSELLLLYETHHKDLSLEQLQQIISKMGKNNRSLEQIKMSRMKKWEQYEIKLKKKNLKPSPCPYRFYDSKDIQKHPTWHKLLLDLNERVANMKITEIPLFVEIGFSLNLFLQYIPNSYYIKLLERSKELGEVSTNELVMLFKWICHYRRIRLDKKVLLAKISEEQQWVYNYSKELVLKLVDRRIQLDPSGVIVLMQSVNVPNICGVNSEQLQMLQPVVLKHLANLQFQKSFNVFKVYQYNGIGSLQAFTILKFDLMRKLPNCVKIHYVLNLLNLIKERKVSFYNTYVECYDMLQPISQRIIAQFKNDSMKVDELYFVLQQYFLNGYRDKSFYHLLANQILKKSDQLDLQKLFQAFFMLTLLGVNSAFMREQIFQRTIKEYQYLLDKYKQERTMFLPSNIPNSSLVQEKQSLQQTILHDGLVKCIWAYLRNCSSDQQIKLDELFKIYPKKISSSHPLIYELSLTIENRVRKFNLFPKLIRPKLEDVSFAHLDYYYEKYDSQEIGSVLKLEMEAKGGFVKNIHLKQNHIIREPWSDHKDSIGTEDYRKWLLYGYKADRLFFGGTIDQSSELYSRRQKLRVSLKDQHMTEKVDKQPEVEFYQISDEQQFTKQ